MLSHPDGPHARTAAAMRNGEGFMQIQVANVGPDIAGAAKANLGVEVGPVHIDLAAMGVDDFADLSDGGLKYAMRRGIGHHYRCQVGLVRFGFGPQVGEVNVAFVVASHRYDL